MAEITDAVKLALIDHSPSILAALFAGGSAILGMRNRDKLKEIHITINGRLDALIAAERKAGQIDEQEAAAKRAETTPPLV